MNQLATINDSGEFPVVYAPPTPAEDIASATAIATEVSNVVERQKVFSMIQGKKYLQAEAWQTVVALDHANPITEWVEPIIENGETIGYQAKVNIVKNGEIIASGIMPCGFDDFPCRGKSGMARTRACMSSAQTWAGAKAARTKYAWIVVLAGYEPTPAEEMAVPQEITGPTERPQRASRQSLTQSPRNSAQGTCEEHNKSWAPGPGGRIGHPIGNGEFHWKDEAEHIEVEGKAVEGKAVDPPTNVKSRTFQEVMNVLSELDAEDQVCAYSFAKWGTNDIQSLTTARLAEILDWMREGMPEIETRGE